ncbi:hypothetical protein C461_00337 [Halorubrum aidingense JCM 13560]|uniref:Uncharacterized protein n=1 Tax=Halorubrum aidingense JCM 13560 TaxID=1230454 RepID=M0PP91_9EURY|nr:hypothetical protein [Halorubrum aidingense]EMA70690.1 hypothetical protein C461_00337 [Halorubrum aidingense JCM 13560]
MTTVLQTVFLVFFAGIFGTLLLGVLSRDVQAVVNGIASVAAAALPTLTEVAIAFRSGADVAFDPALSAWIAVAGFLHMLGMLRWYDTVSWWDHVTHTVSAALLAALVYASLQTPSALGSQVTDGYAALFTVLFTLGAGVCWEFVELAARELGEHIDTPPVLEHYGFRDTVLDMAFNGIGAIVVVAFDVRIFVSVVAEIPRVTETAIIASTVLMFVGALTLGFALELVHRTATDTE